MSSNQYRRMQQLLEQSASCASEVSGVKAVSFPTLKTGTARGAQFVSWCLRAIDCN